MTEWYSHPGIKWINHAQAVKQIAFSFFDELPESLISILPQSVWIGLLKRITLLHDLGKITPFFQNYLNSDKKLKSDLTNHALLSALITYWEVESWLASFSNEFKWKNILPAISFTIIRYHHGHLDNPEFACRVDENQSETIKQQWSSIDLLQLQQFWKENNFSSSLKTITEKINSLPKSFRPIRQLIKFLTNNNDTRIFYLTNLLFSLLIDADKTSVGLETSPSLLESLPSDIVDKFHQKMGWDKPQNKFDRLRVESYQEVMINLREKANNHIFSIQLPTGFGKTLTALSVALKLQHIHNLKRIIYCLPFTSIIDQNFEEIKNMIHLVTGTNPDSTIILKHHHLSDIFYQTQLIEYDPLESQLLIEGWQSKIIVTTFVQFFHTLLGYKNKALRKYHRLANSVVILDENQTIPFKYWKLIGQSLKEFAELFNIYIIVLSATQPALFKPEESIPLVSPKKYFSSLKRVQLNIISSDFNSLEHFAEFVMEKSQGHQKIIVVLNTINSAQQLYSILKKVQTNLYFLSSHVIPRDRLKRIVELNHIEQYFLISTQVIEAGVNIDSDVTFRDFGPVDSIQQIAGRCNRFAQKRKGLVYLCKIKDKNTQRLFASYIYDNFLLDLTEKTFPGEKISEKLFLNLCTNYYSKLAKFPQNESDKLIDSLSKLKYQNDDYALNTFRLIHQNYEKYDVFIEVDNSAKKIWNEFILLRELKDSWERKRRYTAIKNELMNYIISINIKDIRKNPPPYINGIYYVSNNQLEEFYDKMTGFKTTGSISIW